jgi:hypothetical protein
MIGRGVGFLVEVGLLTYLEVGSLTESRIEHNSNIHICNQQDNLNYIYLLVDLVVEVGVVGVDDRNKGQTCQRTNARRKEVPYMYLQYQILRVLRTGATFKVVNLRVVFGWHSLGKYLFDNSCKQDVISYPSIFMSAKRNMHSSELEPASLRLPIERFPVRRSPTWK